MKVGVFTVLFSQRPFEEALDYIKAAGCEAVEIGCGGYPGTAHCIPSKLLADAAARDALRLGTPDGRMLYHAGRIAMALDRTDEARDLLTRAAAHEASLPPIQVPELHAALDALGG